MKKIDIEKIKNVQIIVNRFCDRVGFQSQEVARISAIHDSCISFGLEAIRDAFNMLEKQNIKYFPKLGEIIATVKSIKSRDIYFSPADSICRYSDHEETKLSISLCKKKVCEEESRISKLQFGKVFCAWHRDREYSKNNPNSLQAKVHAKTLKFFERAIELKISPRNFDNIDDFCEEMNVRVYNEGKDASNIRSSMSISRLLSKSIAV